MSLRVMQAPQMMCYQCEQTAAGTGCTTVGICTKTPRMAGLQDMQMAYSKRLCQLALLLGPGDPLATGDAATFLLESLFATLTNVNFDDERFKNYLERAAMLEMRLAQAVSHRLGAAAVPMPPAELPATLPLDEKELRAAAAKTGLLARSACVGNDDLFGVIEMATYGLKGLAAYYYHAEQLGSVSEQDRHSVLQEIFRIGNYLARAGSSPPFNESLALEEALAECLAVGELNLKVMRLLDAAHCKAFGSPSPEEVMTTPISGRHAVLVSGHDLKDLKLLLEQSKDHGVDVYTHGEMLPAHGYPGLRKFKHLRGHFGTHWANQIHEFRDFPGAILMTSNCLRPPSSKYSDRLWTSGPVGCNNVKHISDNDFMPLINQAKELPVLQDSFGRRTFDSSVEKPKVVAGFGHDALTGMADKIIDAIRDGKLKHIFVIGGCDGTETARSYYTDLALSTPQDSIMLTMGCGKFRLNGFEHGTVAGLPRLLDMGQCNDAFGAVVVAQKLAEKLGCPVSDLPLHFSVSWFEQKAVAVLLTLLHLDFKNIRLGPNVPAFLTANVQELLRTRFGLKAISGQKDDDLAEMLSGQ